ncbi:MAG: DUF3581 family protein [Ectothiorhodospiraceae bacterium]|jgi:hypothetical protein
MLIDDFHRTVDGTVCIDADQGSRFAKEIAGDYNPIHDTDAKRFCVPGDLLFALVLARYGLSGNMRFAFRGLVGANVPLRFPPAPDEYVEVADTGGKVYLTVDRHGPRTDNPAALDGFTRAYVAFSGRNFPQFLHPLMAEKGVMFNPDRPLVIYDSMSFTLETPNVDEPALELTGSSLDVAGKRADALLHFRITDCGRHVGTGSKKLVLSGLRPYDEDRMQRFIDDFNRRRTAQ